MVKFKLISKFKPKGDQPEAIKKLAEGLEKGDKFQTLLGVTGSGKSLDRNEPLLIYKADENGAFNPGYVKIGAFIDKIFNKYDIARQINEDTQICIPQEKYYALSFSPQSCQQEIKPITSFVRHTAPSRMYLLRTVCGRESLITGEHNFWVMRNGMMILIKTDEIKQNDCIPLPLFIPSSNQDLKFINLLELLNKRKIYVEANLLFKKLMKMHGKQKLRNVISKYYKDANAKLFSVEKGIKGCKFPLDKFKRILDKLGYNPSHEDLLEIKLFSRSKKYSVSANLLINDELLSLMGFFLAEGHASRRYCLLTNFDLQNREKIIYLLNHLKIGFTLRKNSDFQISSKLFSTIFDNLLGSTSRKKKLPDFWGKLSLRQIGIFLKSYYEGDGWVENGTVACGSASKQLISDLSYALFEFGIWARIKKVWKKAKNAQNHKGDWYYQISISGHENLDKFNREIGFLSQRKTGHLSEELKTQADTNVDLIHGIGQHLKKIRIMLDMAQKHIATPSQLNRSTLAMIELGKRAPSRTVFLRMGNSIWERLEQLCGVDRMTYDYIQKVLKVGNLRWTKIASIKKVEYKGRHVYDISVADNETFLAGSGGLFLHNTFTMANVIEKVQKPTLVLSHNKTLAAQLCQEFRSYFPDNAVQYFVSYYDYYQPEAYIATTDTYIEKEATVNEEIDRLRHAATMSLIERRDVVIVASVSCIYGLGAPKDYLEAMVPLKVGQAYERYGLLQKLVSIKYDRNDVDLTRGRFRVRGSNLEVQPAYEQNILRLHFDEEDILRKIEEVDPKSQKVVNHATSAAVYPATHFVTFKDRLEIALGSIQKEFEKWSEKLRAQNKLLELQRLTQRTKYDLDMIRELGYCQGIENYSRHMEGRAQGTPPSTLLDYFPDDFLMFIDESHVTVPQVRAMYGGDRSRKNALIEHGFRLPSAYDNRPLKFEEFEQKFKQVVFVSATPAQFELTRSQQVVEQINRPTGLIDPEVVVRKSEGQVQDLLAEIKKRVEKKERVLVTTLTKRMAEDLAEYLDEAGFKVRYLHSDVETLDRIDILRGLRKGEFDILVGINLLREGLDLPEVSLVAILDADKEGFLRGETSLIQTIGRAARNINGQVILYAGRETDSMKKALKETNRRRKLQLKYNTKHKIKPQTIVKEITDISETIQQSKLEDIRRLKDFVPEKEIPDLLRSLEEQMQIAATALEFERAGEIRDRIKEIKKAFRMT